MVDINHIDGMLWTPIRTKPRREKKLAEYCTAKKITHYLPLKQSIKRYQRRTQIFYPPMFPGYIFCHLNDVLYKDLVLSHAVFFKVGIDDLSEEGLIRDLTNVRIFEEYSQVKEITVKPEIVMGTPVKVVSGPLAGTFGIIQERKGDLIVYINIEMLGHSVSTKVDIGEVELAE